jgi:hypothetical protein
VGLFRRRLVFAISILSDSPFKTKCAKRRRDDSTACGYGRR